MFKYNECSRRGFYSTALTSNWSARVVSILLRWKRFNATTDDCDERIRLGSFDRFVTLPLLCKRRFW